MMIIYRFLSTRSSGLSHLDFTSRSLTGDRSLECFEESLECFGLLSCLLFFAGDLERLFSDSLLDELEELEDDELLSRFLRISILFFITIQC